ncbi:diaminopimelate decarboxylase [Ignatzschineria ureiclastica]|uniref:Diaminopimelate decarboxylase n=1 Tax=Ignatzschineria ureiclastica TaxID=472582 RepID=A0A2U2ACB5_9GAMM|nr:diaminopimelate decarboxylase [Ignatzschineria ureiclastica]PWD80305.1 diaminopimelate decarboxylase [Ignatzschineria ureiclastica]GHA02853.1 diaminopimelate decarboxylase [Ignatzschineria ureiclastica]
MKDTMNNVELTQIAQTFQTPLYLYDAAQIEANYRAYAKGFGDYPHLICYAVKANSNLSILQLLAKMGSGFDIVSQGELKRVLAAGGDPKKVVYSGVGKRREDLIFALKTGIACFNIESIAEIHLLNEVATELNIKAPVSLRINPNVDAKTHPYISTGLKENKFGIRMEEAFELYQMMATMPSLMIEGMDFHIGSQLTEISPYAEALDLTLALIDRLADAGITLKHLDMGGGLGIQYEDETLIDPADWIALAIEKIGARSLKLVIEPGRSIVGNAGMLITEVILTKENEGKHFAVVDAAMNDLIRPALYDAWMEIRNLSDTVQNTADMKSYDIVGPICETGDFLGKNRMLALKAGDYLMVKDAGAYGFAMASNYNSRGRAAEVLLQDGKARLIRTRETEESLFELEVAHLVK